MKKLILVFFLLIPVFSSLAQDDSVRPCATVEAREGFGPEESYVLYSQPGCNLTESENIRTLPETYFYPQGCVVRSVQADELIRTTVLNYCSIEQITESIQFLSEENLDMIRVTGPSRVYMEPSFNSYGIRIATNQLVESRGVVRNNIGQTFHWTARGYIPEGDVQALRFFEELLCYDIEESVSGFSCSHYQDQSIFQD